LTKVVSETYIFDSGNNIIDVVYSAWTSNPSGIADVAYYAPGRLVP